MLVEQGGASLGTTGRLCRLGLSNDILATGRVGAAEIFRERLVVASATAGSVPMTSHITGSEQTSGSSYLSRSVGITKVLNAESPVSLSLVSAVKQRLVELSREGVGVRVFRPMKSTAEQCASS